ncbi:MAG: tetratricopeptide repeat protein [Bacteroidetes bacterium]|nr:tetratricopeptide repeat protein [Bacteroidota bacterium]
MKKNIIFAILTVIILISCSDNKNKDLQNIKDLEKKLTSNSTEIINIKQSKELVSFYKDFAKEYPKDTNSVNFLFKAASLSMNIGQAKQSVELFDKIITDYPDFSKVSDCMFLKAFVYDEKLKDLVNAKVAYKAFLEKYPTHDFAKDAKACLNNLGKTPEQLIREFEDKQKEDSLHASK